MNLLLLGLSIGTIGKIILGIAVLRVHAGILKEHKLDNVVFAALKREQYVTFFGIVLIIIGYVLEIYFYSGSTELLTCTGRECAAAVGGVLSN
jgi:hypothetical protein